MQSAERRMQHEPPKCVLDAGGTSEMMYLCLTRALQPTPVALGGRMARIICQRLWQPTGRFRRRSMSFDIGPHSMHLRALKF